MYIAVVLPTPMYLCETRSVSQCHASTKAESSAPTAGNTATAQDLLSDGSLSLYKGTATGEANSELSSCVEVEVDVLGSRPK